MNLPRWGTTFAAAFALLLALIVGITAFAPKPLLANEGGIIRLALSNSLPELSESNALYSLAGAEFGVFSDYQCTQRVGSMRTDENGHAEIANLNAARHFIRQERPSEGFTMTKRLMQADVSASNPISVQASVTPCYSTPEVLVRETNIETNSPYEIIGANFGNAIYSISHYASHDASSLNFGPTRTWKFRSDERGEVRLSNDCLVDGSPLYSGPQGALVMPLGTYIVTMEKEPQGYVPSRISQTGSVIAPPELTYDPICKFAVFEQRLQPIRGDVSFRKTDASGTPLSGIPFLLRYEGSEAGEPCEEHVIVTNALGDFSSHADFTPHDMRSNKNDSAIIAAANGSYQLDEDKLSPDYGIWFSLNAAGERSLPENASGALPYGSYTLQELPCSKNANMNLTSTRFSIYRDSYTVTLDNIVSTAPSISGYAFDTKAQGKLVRPMNATSVSNEITYRNLIAGTRYTLSCAAVSSSTGRAIPGPDGRTAFSFIEFTPSEQHGTITLELDVDTSEFAGERIALLAELKSSDGMIVAQENARHVDQELSIEPSLVFTAVDALDLDKYCMGSDASIRERLEYEGLRSSERYTLVCTLNDKATGNALRDALGNVITSSFDFAPESKTGYVDIELPFDASAIAGHDVVVFDKLLDENGVLMAQHQDLDEFDQTVKTVKLSSEACDKADGDKLFDGKSNSVTICDTVTYANLIPGDEYLLHCAIMDKETGTALLVDERPVTAEVPFVAREISGTIEAELSFDASAQPSQVLVIFDTLEHDGNVIAEHADLEDVAQTVTSQEVDDVPASKIEEQQTPLGSSSSKGPSISTGDRWILSFFLILLMISCAAICIGYASHRKRKTLEAIARIGDSDR